MKYIEQIIKPNNKLWLYLPFTLLFIGIMFLNWLFLKITNLDINELITKNIENKGKNINFLETVSPLVFFLFILLIWVKFIHKQTLRSLITARHKIDWGRVLFSFSLWAVIVIGFFVYEYNMHPENYVWNFDWSTFSVFLIIAIIFVPLQTSFEEIFIRGYLMQGIGIASRSRLVALVVTSLFFGLMHISNPEVGKIGYFLMIYYIGTGFFLGIITLMDEGLELALGFHAANNLVAALLVTSNWTAFQTESLFLDIGTPEESLSRYSILFQVGILLPVMLIIFAKVYRWKNWRLKLTGEVINQKNEQNEKF